MDAAGRARYEDLLELMLRLSSPDIVPTSYTSMLVIKINKLVICACLDMSQQTTTCIITAGGFQRAYNPLRIVALRDLLVDTTSSTICW